VSITTGSQHDAGGQPRCCTPSIGWTAPKPRCRSGHSRCPAYRDASNRRPSPWTSRPVPNLVILLLEEAEESRVQSSCRIVRQVQFQHLPVGEVAKHGLENLPAEVPILSNHQSAVSELVVGKVDLVQPVQEQETNFVIPAPGIQVCVRGLEASRNSRGQNRKYLSILQLTVSGPALGLEEAAGAGLGLGPGPSLGLGQEVAPARRKQTRRTQKHLGRLTVNCFYPTGQSKGGQRAGERVATVR